MLGIYCVSVSGVQVCVCVCVLVQGHACNDAGVCVYCCKAVYVNVQVATRECALYN